MGLHERLQGELKRLFGFAFVLARDEDAARDLVQDTVVKALSAGRVPEDESAFRVWLFRILRNTFIDQLRKSKRERGAAEAEGDGGEFVADFRVEERRRVDVLSVRQGFDRISQPHRDILALVDVVGMSYAEAGDLLGIPNGTVMSRLARARAALVKVMNEDNVMPFPLKARLRGRR